MSWRRFTSLMSGLSPESLFIQLLSKREAEKPIEETQDILADMMGKLSRRKK